jgi:electron transport complex protein RnfE
LPPGAFLLLGLLIAGKNQLDARALERSKAKAMPLVATPSRRVRVTGVIE